jgi:hypothetical protein
MLDQIKPTRTKVARTPTSALRTLWRGWRALLVRTRRLLLRVLGRQPIAAEPANDAFMTPSVTRPAVRAGKVAGRQLVRRLAVTQGSRLVLVFEEVRCAADEGEDSRWQTEPHFVNLYREHLLERRLGSTGARFSARRGPSRI